LVSIAAYSAASYRAYRGYRGWLAEARSSVDGSTLIIVLDETIEENGRTVFARKILTREGNQLRITKQTRGAGEPFLMRQSYELRL
jgi:hypothetical protein